MSDVQDHSVLKWIRGELDSSLDAARHALESYVEGTGPETELDRCITQLHQVRGTLQLMQLYGAAMLAEEMELVAKVLGSLGEQRRKESAEALMVGLVQLPEYLEKIESGTADNPILLLPLMNELRAARDVSLLSEVALFAPDLERKLLPADGSQEANPELPALTRKLRYRYHKALLDWYRGSDSAGGLERIGGIFRELEQAAWTDQVQRLFRVGQAVVNALRDGGLGSGIATKLLVGKIDREIKRIIDAGEQPVAAAPSNDLVKNLLYYTACADSSDPVVAQVRQEFDLTQGPLGQADLAGEQADLHAPGRELLESLRCAISADLTAIKDQLDLFIRGKREDLGRLQAQQEPLKKLADTLGMVGQGELRSRLMRQADKLAEIVAAGTQPDEQDLMAMASDILFIETSLDNLSVVRRYARPQSDQVSSMLPEGEFERLVDSVMHEAGIDMARNKEAIINFIETPDNRALLADVPRRFNGIAGAFSVLSLSDAAVSMRRLNRYVEQTLLGETEVPSAADLDAFADAVTGIEYFMEAVSEGRGIHPEILDVTRDALARLKVPESAHGDEPPALEETPEQAPLTAPVTDSAALEEAVESRAAGEPAEAAPAPTPSADKPALEDIDAEILEIFIEEAEEELAAIQEYLPRWCKNRDDRDALTTFRRSFHTLKGSGRLVGAKTIGEFAWAIENLLNRVIDETIEVSPGVIELLNEAVGILPELIECQKRGVAATVDPQSLMDRAEALAQPGRAAPPVPRSSEAFVASEAPLSAEQRLDALEEQIAEDESMGFAAADAAADEPEAEPVLESLPEPVSELAAVDETTPAAAAETVPAPINMDETLLEIFEAESRTHIETLSQFREACSGNPLACRIGKELVRALHTLHGSAEMAGVDSIAQVSTALESLVADLNSLGRHADGAALELIGRSVDLFNTVLGVINVPGAQLPDWQALVGDIHAYGRAAEQATPSTGAVVPNELPEPAAPAAGEPTAREELLDSPIAETVVEVAQVAEEPVAEPPAAVTEAPAAVEPEIETEAESVGPAGMTDRSLAELSVETISAEPADEPLQAEPEIATEPPVVGGGTAVASSAPSMVDLEGDPELVDIFLEEARELQEALENTLQAAAFELSDKQVSEELQRILHTLKGGARLAGAMPIGDLSHAFESLLTAVDQARVAPGDALVTLTHEVMDRLAEQIDDLSSAPRLRVADDLVDKMEAWLIAGGPPPAATALLADEPAVTESIGEAAAASPPSGVAPESRSTEAVSAAPLAGPTLEPAETVAADLSAEQPGEAVAEIADQAEPEPDTETETEFEPDAAALDDAAALADTTVRAGTATGMAAEEPGLLPGRGQREQVRVRSDLLDRLVNYAGEVSIYRTRIEQQNGQLGFNLSELEQTVSRLRDQLRQLEIETEAQILFRYEQDRGDEPSHDASFDPLELDRFSAMQQVSRSLMETVNDLANINGFLEELQAETDTLLLQQSRITTDLQDGLMRTRMVPFSQIVPRLHRVVRQTCNQLDKRAELVIQGAGSEIDRGILERMIGPLEHILRNAIAHGIESPARRAEQGKAETGQIRLQLSREGSDVQLVISDDGAGVDMASIREQAIKSGLLDPQADVADADVLPFVLEHGFTTAQEVTQISGRGVGLDVVVSEVKQLGGSLDITSQAGQGASFIIRLPLTLAITDALLVELGGEIYAIPHTSVEGVVRVSRQELEACYNGRQTAYSYAGKDYQVRYMGNMLNVGQVNLSDQRKWFPLLLVRAGDHHVAIQVDGLLGNRQIVVKSVGVQVSTVRWISGGTILGDGRVALILDVTALVRSDVAQTAAPHPEVARVDVAAPAPGVGRMVMVVDDSITVRKVTGRLLERHGMNVLTAKDGVDAVAMLQEQRPDIMLLDIEMPRMDGYELARHMRNSDDLKQIPIIMITSRTGDKHRKLAMELGVRRYLGKPYQESELLDNIYSVLNEEAG
ncbi:Hpt domain-containing protein [Sedimenticola hydrogenitrophicus]|uniref:hybrid sensor histidine kinase/response regulator n=1 Tax=Sedimenticola hydrogenitrophicus TaxID=2967975 RepID=UPI0023B11FB6|nr:Hpt domain-containing protein [Sedimenticola hydrogenitrophicus]